MKKLALALFTLALITPTQAATLTKKSFHSNDAVSDAAYFLGSLMDMANSDSEAALTLALDITLKNSNEKTENALKQAMHKYQIVSSHQIDSKRVSLLRNPSPETLKTMLQDLSAGIQESARDNYGDEATKDFDEAVDRLSRALADGLKLQIYTFEAIKKNDIGCGGLVFVSAAATASALDKEAQFVGICSTLH